ncbi:histone deacetylase family protein [Aestuariispira insulae]|uniref:Acetoin utilization deacetylase AcuC-like enzyme n=1 Tax=Aestuariispira insulae TaxID=1461337 RepID=A0A3D9HYZ5_9PROT|nr:histone deacetylase [Aestuariispira insulae]RED54126.1 acetoin utilization deacetylase AcuC-like enzyme [Aestuariispira insulae]
MGIRFFHNDNHPIPLPPGHRFPGGKYRLLYEGLLAAGIVRPEQLLPAPQADPVDILRAHDQDYVDAFEQGTLDEVAMRRIGVPWSEGLVRRVRATMGGAVASAACALETGLSGQLAGGTHHAHRDFGSGYCIFNDQAVAALWALQQPGVSKVAVIDLDVHQGDGTAAILKGNPGTLVFSMHGEKNFPFRKQHSDIDIPLEDGMADDAYLQILEENLPRVMRFSPDLVLYQAGVDALAQDRLGRLALTEEGLVARDQMVLLACREADVPVCIAIGGGYADPIEQSVACYVNTYRMAKSIYGF